MEQGVTLGLHLSIVGGVDKAVDRAVEKHCETLQMFSRNPRGWHSKELSSEEIESYRDRLKRSRLWPVFIHTPYLLNLASPREDVYSKSVGALIEELSRAAQLGVPYVVTHLGSHLGHGKMSGFRRIIAAIELSLSQMDNDIILLLENTAGTRNSMGSSFEDINYILSRIGDGKQVGVCFDTSHAFASGYDLVARGAVAHTLRRFDGAIGLEKLRLVHLNDSKGSLGSRIDRHEHIGMGRIGEQGFRNILKSQLGRLPMILETPIDNRRSDVENLSKIRELASQV